MEKFKHFVWFQLPAIAWAAAIFIQSSLSYIDTPDLGFDLQDKLFHAIEYAILGFLLRRALVFQGNQFVQRNAGWLTILIGGTFAISDEIHQLFVPGRSGEIADAIADCVGIILIVFVYFIGKQIKQRWNQRSLLSVD
jgi:VanZ family protein